ncbi:MAG: hypothetical protein A3C06_04190 [Candidatus Taylorbacteria bacterium RIFCSPHIGHO2_02_FULL_46_13]|uniref:Uncharacterized protein n=1 Tax=Candidatus Taylorbacteria bacterium RIFCSPHIGHO2_02_FULL_46_13 TaxID=1802312 RepID=A0A1G2MU39_9BACT|nr:MAG: hypothetical protein A3C06_04190 [Candidatus Taylorbacteria bacterium RIFCSPHIGHO2_02_FULL_46_13]
MDRACPVRSRSRFATVSSNGGFIALISVIILGFVLLIAVLTLGNRSLGTRFLLLDLERKDVSNQLARACVQVAIIAVVNDSLYNGVNVMVPVGSDRCMIHSVNPVGGESLIKTTASTSATVTNLQVSVDNTNGTIISWQEVPNL